MTTQLARQYAEVLTRAQTEKTPDEFDIFFGNFMGLLAAKRHGSLLPQIAHYVEVLSQAQDAHNTTYLTVANKDEQERYEALLKEHQDIFDTNYELREDADIVGGAIIKNRTHVLDASYHKALRSLYKTLAG